MVQVFTDKGLVESTPEGKSVGEYANGLAKAKEIPGGSFTLKVNGDLLDPGSALKVKDGAVVELVEHVSDSEARKPASSQAKTAE